MEAFSGKTATAVKQDIYAKIMMVSFCAALAFPVEEKVIKEYQEAKKKREVKHGRKINRTYAYWTTKGMLIAMFIKNKIKAAALSVFDKQVELNTDIDRPGSTAQPEKSIAQHSARAQEIGSAILPVWSSFVVYVKTEI